MKKRTFISKTTAVLLSLSVAAGNPCSRSIYQPWCRQTYQKVYLFHRRKSGKSFNRGKIRSLCILSQQVRPDACKRKQKAGENRHRSKTFNVQEKYIYVLKKKNNTLYRITIKNPAKQKKLISSCKELLGVSFPTLPTGRKKEYTAPICEAKKRKNWCLQAFCPMDTNTTKVPFSM